MGTITTTDGTEIYYKDWGSGQPIVFSHGWPLSADDWDAQMLFFLVSRIGREPSLCFGPAVSRAAARSFVIASFEGWRNSISKPARALCTF